MRRGTKQSGCGWLTCHPGRVAAWLSGWTALALATLASQAAPSPAPPVLRVGSELDFRPYAFTDEKGQAAGFSVDLIRAVCYRMGIPVEITTAPWDEVWNGLLEGKFDVLPTVARTPGREQILDFSLAHTESYDAFFRRSGDPEWCSLAEAAGREIVVLRSDAAHHQLVERNFTGQIIPVDSISAGMRLVASGKHDAFLCSKLIGLMELRQARIRGVDPGRPIPDYKRSFSFALRKGQPELLEQLNQGLLIVKTNGEYDEIYRRWLRIDEPWARLHPYLLPALAVSGTLAALAAVHVLFLRHLVRRRTRELDLANQEIQAEVEERRKAEAALQQLNEHLEARIAERTFELRQSEEGLRLQRERMPIGCIVFDEEWRLRQMNPAARRIFGYSEEELQGRHFSCIVPESARAQVDGIVDRLVEGDMAAHSVNENLTRDGRTIICEWTNTPLRDAGGVSRGFLCMVQDVTERKQAEEGLRRSQQTFAEVVERSPFGIYVVDASLRITQMNRGSQEGAFRNLRPSTGRDLADAMRVLWPEEVAVEITQRFRDTLATGEPFYSRDFVNVRRDLQSVESYEWELHRIVLPDGQLGVVCYYFDSTKLREAEAKVRMSEARLRRFFESNMVGTLYWNLDGTITEANGKFLEMLGFTREDLEAGRISWRELTPPDHRASDEAALRSLATAGVAAPYEKEYFRKDGSRLPVILGTAALEGNSQEGVAFVLDITERKQAEERTRRQNALLAGIARVLNASLGQHTAEELGRVCLTVAKDLTQSPLGVLSRLSPRSGRLEPIASEGREGTSLAALRLAEDVACQEILSSGKPFFAKVQLPPSAPVPDGGPPCTPFLGVPLNQGDQTTGVLALAGRPGGYSATEQATAEALAPVIQQAIARKAAEEALRASEERFRLLVEQTPDGIFVSDSQGHYTDVNQAGCDLLGFTRQEILERSIADLVTPEECSRIPTEVARLATEPVTCSIWRFRRKDGSCFTGEVVARQLRDGRLQAILRDITERQQAEEALKASLQEKEVLLKEIHHRVKNNMQVISSLASLQAEDLQTREPLVRSAFQDMTHRVRSMAMVHERLYESPDLAHIEFSTYARSLLESLLRAHRKPGREVQLALDAEPLPLSVDIAVPCGLILNELAVNALKHAFPGRPRGSLTVSLHALAPGTRVRLTLRDDGVGLPPGFEWREAKSLGLRLVQMLARQLHASVELSNNGGTEFSIEFDRGSGARKA